MARIVGTSGRDVLRGTNGNDKLIGKGGNDKLIGRGGNDILKGGKGKDTLIGGKGNDTLKGGAGNDKLMGGKGDDTLSGQKGNDKLDAGSGNDKLMGGNGNDLLDAGPGVDDIFGGSGADVFRFERGDGLWPQFPGPNESLSEPLHGVQRMDNIVFDYQDGIDKFDLPDADLDLTSPFAIGPLLDNTNWFDPVGGFGGIFAFGEESDIAAPGVNNPLQNTAVFVTNYIVPLMSPDDFI